MQFQAEKFKAIKLKAHHMYGTVEPRYDDPRYNDIPDITMNIILCPGKSYSKMYGSEPR